MADTRSREARAGSSYPCCRSAAFLQNQMQTIWFLHGEPFGMGASVRIEDGAFADPRIELLGQFLGTSKYDALGRLAYLWRYCTDQASYTAPRDIVALYVDPEALIRVGLASVETEDSLRIRGTEGRIEWIEKLRANGKKGGRPRKNKNQGESKPEPGANQRVADSKPNENQLVSKTKPNGKPGANPPAPAPAPAPVKRESGSHYNRPPSEQSPADAVASGPPPLSAKRKALAEAADALADAIAQELNQATGRRFDPSGKQLRADAKSLAAKGYTPEQARDVVRAKAAQWLADPKMREQLKPSVIARPSNFAKYLEEDVGTGSVRRGSYSAPKLLEVRPIERYRGQG